MAPQNPSAELLDDLCSRFILNVPAEELESFERLLFLVEQAHWYYEDFIAENDPNLRSLSLKEFTTLIFQQCPALKSYAVHLNDIYNSFLTYKMAVPVMGAIILDPSMEKCLLVKGWKKDASWGFPRGKVNRDEADHDCAVREVLEETGFDISSRLVRDDFIESRMRQQRSRLFIITDVEESTSFVPLCRKEISAFAWHVISHLPSTYEESRQGYENDEGAKHRFFNVWPYVPQLRRWIKNKRRSNAAASKVNRKGTVATATVTPVAAQQTAVASNSAVGNVVPGTAFADFKFDRKAILQHLKAAA